MSLFRWIDHIDKALIRLINTDSDHVVLDPIMLLLRHPATWTPLYAFMLIYIFRHARQCAWLFIFFTLLGVFLTDTTSAALLKPWFGRLRPCQDPALIPVLRSLVDCGGLYSMPSSHAANHFGLATFWYYGIQTLRGQKWRWLWVWAAAIGYAQIYVGKHYPSDIVVGALLGMTVGRLLGLLFERL